MILAAIGLCCFVLLAVFMGYMLLGSADAEEPEEADIFGGGGGEGGGGGRGGGGASLPPAVPLPPHTARTPGTTATGPGTPEETTGSTPVIGPPAVLRPSPATVAPPVIGPPAVLSPTPTPTPTPMTTTTVPTTTTKAFSVDELVCTVGGKAIFPEMIPTDGLCNSIYYTNVAVVHGILHGIETEESWATFKLVMKNLTKTSGGIGFDIRYSAPTSMNATTEQNLQDHSRNNNLKHYGVLNVLHTSTKVKGLYDKAKVILANLKALQVSTNAINSKTIIALGIFNYRSGNAVGVLGDMFNDAVTNHVADTVIVYSSVGWIERESDCYSHPPSVFQRSDLKGPARLNVDRAPDIKTITTLMTRDKQFPSNTKVGLSFELGTLVYTVKSAKKGVDSDLVNIPCKSLYVTNFDVVPCLANTQNNRAKRFEGVEVAQSEADTSQVILFESNNTIFYKIKKLAENSTFLRPGMSLLLLNAHLGDFRNKATSPCAQYNEKDRDDPFYRIRVIKAWLGVN
ncbi:uncharacterized protein [Dermacentor albipictus]|uniref:uncharacterized protein n=1 Tax=Dermacentor albipictus TaxID=60249 RepID=UPI0038FC297E